ncbi:hypothetical protein [Natrialba aegyptia]|uniref:Uncharacterized protein n=1 Tax=Natrialba aegyptia DSM 13077 TaxID=1227491 RepID=M0B9I2_9EURY|nr:hypothetical protein [Natrialba aegyptia]ELZ07541.1 hypothetical protein C480_05776 [Natrialba aegyptia DSM 13077]
MSATRIVGLALLTVVGLAIAPVAGSALTMPAAHQSAAGANEPSGGLQTQTQTQAQAQVQGQSHGQIQPQTQAQTANTTTNTTVATFLQTTSADAQSSVDAGLFDATYHAADTERRAALVTDRADEFEQRLAELEAEREDLREQEDSLSSAAYEARLTRLTVTIASLNRSIERTKSQGVAAGLNSERFETLQQNASDLAGPDIAAMAQKVVGVDRHPGGGIGVANGPPADRGPPNSSASAGAAEPPGRQPSAAVPGNSPENNGREAGQDRGQERGQNQSQTRGQNPTLTPTPAQNAGSESPTDETGTDDGPGQGNQSDRGTAQEQSSGNSGENSDPPGNGSPAQTGPPTDATEPSTPETDADSASGPTTDDTSSSNADTDADSDTDIPTAETTTND